MTLLTIAAAAGLVVAAGALLAAARRRLPAATMPVCFALFVGQTADAASSASTAALGVIAIPAAGAVLAMATIVLGVLTSGTQLHPRWWRRFERDLAAHLEAAERGSEAPS